MFLINWENVNLGLRVVSVNLSFRILWRDFWSFLGIFLNFNFLKTFQKESDFLVRHCLDQKIVLCSTTTSQCPQTPYQKSEIFGREPKVIVGYDRRFFSDRFAQTTAEVFAGNGFQVVLENPGSPHIFLHPRPECVQAETLLFDIVV